jgi:hypothetical protein
LDRWVHPRSIRRYQEWILRGQGFQLQLDDGTYELVGCRADLDRNRLLLRRYQDGFLQVLLSSECGEGYALTGQPLQAPGPEDGLFAPLGPAIVRTGNENFAHFLWNELDPILEMLRSGQPLEVVQDTDTVLALAELAGVRCLDLPALSQRTSIRLGGTLVTERARQTVLAALRAAPLEPLPAERARPLILLGVRGPGRRELANEEQYYGALIAALRQAYPSGLILLDGFTYQGHGRGVGVVEQREQACTARIGRIITACGGSQLENLSGLGFPAWLQRSEGIRFYVTHEGTMQHKVGWLRPQIPGLVLVGSADAAAIAGAQGINLDEYYVTGASSATRLQPADVIRLATRHIRGSTMPAGMVIERIWSDGIDVTVRLSAPLRLPFPLAPTLDRITVESRARLQYRPIA